MAPHPLDVPPLDGAWSWLRDTISWLAATASLATVMGWLNLGIGLLSAAWLATQLYRFWRYESYSLARRREAEEQAQALTLGARHPRPPPQEPRP
jgi:hypothetical protein